MARILIIDDDRSLLRALRLSLSSQGHRVEVATTGEGGLTKAAVQMIDIVILDMGLPDLSGIDVARRLRKWSTVPIIVLSATGLEETKVAALDSGADDYVTKPFGIAELDARIRVCLRRAAEFDESGDASLQLGPLNLDPTHQQARLSGEQLRLTAKEFDLLYFLARNQGKICTKQMILGAVWGGENSNADEYLRVYIYRLRRRLATATGIVLTTSPGIGYSISET